MAPVDDNFIRILIASDIHLGFGEKLPERAMDSFNTFDELLTIGKEREVDMCLLGGDLFHENKPTRAAQINCVQILSKHVFGNDPIYLEYASNPQVDFRHCNTKAVNYEDQNLNISLPIFSIHGNHDDPSGLGGHSCLDILHESKLVNYFGKIDNLKEIKLSPILLKKNGVKLAIYGLSSVKDERLHRLFREKKVIFETPDDIHSWFSIIVLHQNRAKRGPTNYIPESFLPQFVNLVIWGHEHDCRIEPEHSPCGKDFFVSQPGSPVATSLCDGESIQKKVGVLLINANNEFKLEPIPLQSVRPFIFLSKCLTEYKKLNLDDKDEKRLQQNIEKELTFEVQDMIQRSEAQLTGHPKQGKLPLIRLRIEYSDERQQLNPVRFGNSFTGQVANPTSLLHFKKRNIVDRKIKDETTGQEHTERVTLKTNKNLEDYITEYFQDNKEKLTILSVRGLNSAVNSYINKSDGDAIRDNVHSQLERRQQDILQDGDIDSDDQIQEALENIRNNVDEDQEAALAVAELNREGRKRAPVPESTADDLAFNSDDDGEAKAKPAAKPTTRGRGRGRGAAAATSRKQPSPRQATATSRRGAASKTVIPDSEDEDDIKNDSDQDDDDFSMEMSSRRQTGGRSRPTPAESRRPVAAPVASPPKTRGRGRARGRGAGAAASTRGRGGSGQTSIMAAFATQSQRSSQSQASLSMRSTQRNRKQQFESDSESD